MKKFSLCIGYIVCSVYNPYICQCAAEIGVDQTACHFGCLHCDTRTHKRCQINIATIFVFEWRSSAVECQATRVPENRRRWEIRKIRMIHQRSRNTKGLSLTMRNGTKTWPVYYK